MFRHTLTRPRPTPFHSSATRGVIYCDLKPKNILAGADKRTALIDFGLPKMSRMNTLGLNAPPTPNGQTGFVTLRWVDTAGGPGCIPTSKSLNRDMATMFCGTGEYLAPEIVQGLPYSHEVDWWAIGMVLWCRP
ncbi:hypothetical protein FRC10_000288 [Ceratobasidium sp. 414]|nr:hypothetical protein FRC10_000288 [Ceratobasidium sp. 414]